MTERDFRRFIEAISNDIINWDTLRTVMKNGGVTYANKEILTSDDSIEVQQVNKAKFISGANLCINLTDVGRVSPFYNPPGARGEDTFLSTCLSERKVLYVPVYTFHNGFMNVLAELEKYNRNVSKHYSDFMQTQQIWVKLMEHFAHLRE